MNLSNSLNDAAARRRHTARSCFIAAVLTIGPVSVVAQTGTFVDRNLPTDLRVMSYNVFSDGIFDSTGMAKFNRLIDAIDPDVLNLQEIYDHSASQTVALMNSIAPLGGGATWRLE